jgi:hypothetical protein
MHFRRVCVEASALCCCNLRAQFTQSLLVAASGGRRISELSVTAVLLLLAAATARFGCHAPSPRIVKQLFYAATAIESRNVKTEDQILFPLDGRGQSLIQ